MSDTRRTPPPPPFALSIVIPVYNGASSIAELVGALEQLQIPGGHEIVLVNDGSPDKASPFAAHSSSTRGCRSR